MTLKVSKNYFFLLLWVCVLLKSAYTVDEKTQSTDDRPRIQCKTIHSFGQVLDTLIERKSEVEPQCLMLLLDWDQTVVKNDNEDTTLREPEIPDIIKKIKDFGISIMVVTARWSHSRSGILYYEKCRKTTEGLSGIILSDQTYCRNLMLDVRRPGLDRGIHVNGFTYTGSRKGEVLISVLEHPQFPTHPKEFIYVEDNQKFIDMVGAAFKHREEKITILYYPPSGEQ